MALKKERIVAEALKLLDKNGLEGVTLRKLAKELNVQAPALYWHFKNKNALVNEMAETILEAEFHDLHAKEHDDHWQDWLVDMFNRLRRALLSHTDGGRVVAGAHLSLVMANFSETTIKSLVDAGVNLRQARLIVVTATRFTFGHVIEEQTSLNEKDMDHFHIEPFKEEHPTLTASIEEYFSDGKTVDDLFNDGLKLMIQ